MLARLSHVLKSPYLPTSYPALKSPPCPAQSTRSERASTIPSRGYVIRVECNQRRAHRARAVYTAVGSSSRRYKERKRERRGAVNARLRTTRKTHGGEAGQEKEETLPVGELRPPRECSPIISGRVVDSNWTLRRWVGSEMAIAGKKKKKKKEERLVTCARARAVTHRRRYIRHADNWSKARTICSIKSRTGPSIGLILQRRGARRSIVCQLVT